MNFDEEIKAFKKAGNGLMTLDQYLSIGRELKKISPCNFLVFGLLFLLPVISFLSLFVYFHFSIPNLLGLVILI